MNNYKKLGVFKSKGRFFKDKISKYRSPFQRDRDRIIHSASFRRLKHKTQVFVNTDGDHYRTRMTHSLEVAQIARSISKYLNLNDDLAETLSLAHDLGHTPFGHAGEEVLNDCMSNHGGFDHNLQTLRIVMFIEKKYIDFDGLNLSFETLDGLKAGLFTLEELLEINFFKDIYKKYKNKKKIELQVLIHQIIRDSIDLMVKDIINNTIQNIKKNKIKKLNNVFDNKDKTVEFSDKLKDIDNDIRSFLRKNMYDHKEVQKKNNAGKKIVNFLFKKLYSNTDNNFSIQNFDKDKARSVADFISGMTDRYAINLYEELK